MRPYEDEGGKKGRPRTTPRHSEAELSAIAKREIADTRFRSRPGSKKQTYSRRPGGLFSSFLFSSPHPVFRRKWRRTWRPYLFIGPPFTPGGNVIATKKTDPRRLRAVSAKRQIGFPRGTQHCHLLNNSHHDRLAPSGLGQFGLDQTGSFFSKSEPSE
jgi:hypothetical protein